MIILGRECSMNYGFLALFLVLEQVDQATRESF